MNEFGLAVSSVSRTTGTAVESASALLRAVVVRRVLRDAESMDAAVEMLRHQDVGEGAQFCLSHAADGRVCRIDFERDGARVLQDPSVAVSLRQAPLDAPAGLPSGVPAAVSPHAEKATDGASFSYQQLVDLQANWPPATGPTSFQYSQLRTWVHKSLRLVMEPASGEMIVRPGRTSPSQGLQRCQIELRALSAPSPVPASAGPPVTSVPVEEYLAVCQSVDGKPPFETHGQVCQRFVLRTLQTPLAPASKDKQITGSAVIVGQNEVAHALRRKLTDMGITAVSLPLLDDPDKTASTMDKIWQKYRPLNFFIVTAFDEDTAADLRPGVLQRRIQRGVLMPYFACQKWFSLLTENNLVEQAKVAAATCMGGDLGLAGRLATFDSGALCGFIKALGIEVGYATKWAFVAKAVDAARGESPDLLAEAMIRELLAISWFAEFGYARGNRCVMGALHRPAEPVPGSEPTPGRPWLLTGGARGITAAIARELGRRFGVKLHLVGTSPLPEIDPAWRNMTSEQRRELRGQLTNQALAEKRVPNELWHRVEKAIEIDTALHDMRAAGLDVTYHSGDVSDREAMRALIADIREADGPLEGIVHGAGFENASRFAKKSADTVRKTLAAKVEGAAVLMDLTRNDPLRYFFGFGSISGRWGSIGQTDYCLASDMLCKMVNWYRTQRPEVRASCFHWAPWAEVGMAARGETRGVVLCRKSRCCLWPKAFSIS